MTITLPYPPSANRYWRVVNGRAIKSAAARDYQATASAMAVAQGMKPIMEGEVAVFIDVYRPARRGDTDNLIKVAVDSLKGIAFKDDAQVKRIEIERHDTDKGNPRAVVTIERAAVAEKETA